MEDKKTQRLESIAFELEKRKKQHQQSGGHQRRIRKILRRLLMGVAILCLMLALVFFFNFFRLNSDLIEGHVKQGVIPNLTMGRFNLHVGSISGNLLYGVELANILVQNPHFNSGSTLLTVPKVSLRYSLFDVLLGQLVLQRLDIDSPVLTIRRNEQGRGIWDFSTDALPAAGTLSETTWQKQEKAQILADRYLADIRIKNLSVFVPAPEKLVTDEFAARLIRLPAKTWQLNGVNMSLRKYPADDFISHIFRISLPEKPDYLTFQITRLKSNGNFTVNFDALGQNFNFAVENMGQDGRKINLYDGRHRDRLNLEWFWARNQTSLPDKIRGLTGILRVDQFKDLFGGVLPSEYDLSGTLKASFACESDKPLYDAAVDFDLASCSVNLPYVPIIEGLSAKAKSLHRLAKLESLRVTVASVTSSHSGYFDWQNEADITARLNSNIAGDEMSVQAAYSREAPGSHRLAAKMERRAGVAEVAFVRKIEDRAITYSDFLCSAGIVADGKASDILPLNLLPTDLRRQILGYFERVDMLGPFGVSTAFASLDDFRTSTINLDFTGTRILSRLNRADCFALSGKASVASSVLVLDGLSATIDNLKITTAGRASLIAGSPFISDYDVKIDATLTGTESFAITAERLQASMGLKTRPDFDKIELAGDRLFSIVAGSNVAENSALADIKKLRFWRRGKALWADNAIVSLTTGPCDMTRNFRPDSCKADIALEFFGIPVEAAIAADLASSTIESLSCKGGGTNFSRILEAIKTQPEGREFLQKYPLNLSGAFNFAFLGSGNLKKPVFDGWVRFPALNVGLPSFNARLPFYAQLRTEEEEYLAAVKAGEASLKVKDLSFDLGKTSASLRFQNLFAASGPNIFLNASSEIFGAAIKADGCIQPSRKTIEKLELSLGSRKIETLAAEIARIGRFAMPFSLSGEFGANAVLKGPFAAPSASGGVKVSYINLDFLLASGGGKNSLAARNFAGNLKFAKKGDRYFELEVEKFGGKIIGADVAVAGKAHLANLKNGFKPVVDNLHAGFAGLDAAQLYTFLAGGLLPKTVTDVFRVKSGLLAGDFTLAGTPARITASGSATIRDGNLGFVSLKDNIKKLSADLAFEGRTDSKYSRIGLKNLSAEFGRSVFEVPDGWLEDPLKTGKISLKGRFARVFPADLLAMLGGMIVNAVTFPDEGSLEGALEVSGSLGEPMLLADVRSNEMTVRYDSGEHVFAVPVGKNHLRMSFNPGNGAAVVERGELEVLGGNIALKNARGTFMPGRPFVMNLEGDIAGLDLAKFRVDDAEALKGRLGGAFKADWAGQGSRDAVFNLDFKDIHIPRLPLIDQKTLDKAGADFIEKPDFKVGQLNFYVTSDEDDAYRGRLLVADGLFAGPHLRVEIGNSEFNPQAMQLDAKLMINPQSLRQTDIGRKLKKWTVTLQDKNTGVPYVDLAVAGTWAKPELISRAVEKKATRRVKRNFIGRIFGGHRPHKASVEELMQWFPGWKKGI